MPEAIHVHLRQRLEIVHRAQHIVHFVPAVVDLVVKRFAVPGAAAVVRADDDVAASTASFTNGHMRHVPVAMYAAMNPHQRRVAARTACSSG